MGGDWRGNEVAGGWPPSFILGIALCVSLVIAYFVYQHVEVRQVGKRLKRRRQPGMKLGKEQGKMARMKYLGKDE